MYNLQVRKKTDQEMPLLNNLHISTTHKNEMVWNEMIEYQTGLIQFNNHEKAKNVDNRQIKFSTNENTKRPRTDT